ncbi:Mucin-19 [Kitasatospora sp. NPDC048365]|uniref:Mucin-19 n=1 Tax=Kitasatospora sp. NPDC048365 TaxID=3364050 RepID=UPI003714B732
MDSKAYNQGLAELRAKRDDIASLRKELAQLEADRDRRIQALAAYPKANADRLAPAAGLSVGQIVALAPALAPDTAPTAPPTAASAAPEVPEQPAEPKPGTVAHLPATPPAVEAQPSAPGPAAPDGARPPAAAGQPKPGAPRELPSIPDGAEGDGWTRPTAGLVSTRPNFTHQPRQMAFLDTETGVLVHRDQQVRLDLGTRTVAEIITAVYATVPASVERIYVTAGDPWHRDADQHPFLRDAVAAWLSGPLPDGWTVETSRTRDRMAGHLVHERRPVGRWQRGNQHCEIRSVGEWFDPAGADPATVRDAFVLLWQHLRHHWHDVVLLGSPSQTGRDLWTRTIPAKTGAKWADGYPVMSEDIRGLLHATAGQGRTELLTPPTVPTQLPRWVELDRTFAYAKHCWASGVGEPQRVTAATFASWSEKEQTNALFAPSHWHIRVTVPNGWNHVGLLPAPITGDKAWAYPAQGGHTFTTWAGGAEVNLALRNPLQPWRIEILDGLLWESSTPLREWSTHLRDAWNALRSISEVHTDPRQRQAAALAARAVRSILLFGIGGFAQRPRIITGQTPLGSEHQVPDGAQITGVTDTHVTWQQNSGFSRDPNAHPEWAAGVWSAARAALLSTRMREDNISVGALHLPPGSIIAFRTDAIYTTTEPNWPYHGQPGEYLLKGRIPEPVPAPTTDDAFYTLQAAGRALHDTEPAPQ